MEVAKIAHGAVGLRDSKNPDQPFLQFGQVEWTMFIAGIKAGEFQNR